MKTLNEEIQEIKNMKGSKAAKKEAFIKLGLTQCLFSMRATTTQTTTTTTSSFQIHLSEAKTLSNVYRLFLQVKQV